MSINTFDLVMDLHFPLHFAKFCHFVLGKFCLNFLAYTWCFPLFIPSYENLDQGTWTLMFCPTWPAPLLPISPGQPHLPHSVSPTLPDSSFVVQPTCHSTICIQPPPISILDFLLTPSDFSLLYLIFSSIHLSLSVYWITLSTHHLATCFICIDDLRHWSLLIAT